MVYPLGLDFVLKLPNFIIIIITFNLINILFESSFDISCK